MSLRDALLSSLESLPGTRDFHLHVLVSSPRKHSDLFYYAIPRPKTYAQDILVLLSEQQTPSSPRILVTGIEAVLYFLPTTSSAILYVGKVDSTGQAAFPSPTATLVRALLCFYGDPETRPLTAETLWVHIFARAQNQYLFPNSSEWEGKKWLSDVKLCAWWKKLLTEVAAELDSRTTSRTIGKGGASEQTRGNHGMRYRLSYVLPGLSALEAAHTLQVASQTSSVSAATSAGASAGPAWHYGHPYAPSDIPLPCPPPKDTAVINLGHFIPYFDDDPKSRFLDEIAHTSDVDGVKSPERKRRRIERPPSSSRAGAGAEGAREEKHRKGDRDDSEAQKPAGELARVAPDEFWERMSFRQECVSGAVTGFFVLALSAPRRPAPSGLSAPSPLAPRPGQVSAQVNRRVLASLMKGNEFSTRERAVRATETIEQAIRGLCEGGDDGDDAPVAHASSGAAATDGPAATPSDPARARTPEAEAESASLAPPRTPPRTPPPRTGAPAKRAPPADVSPNPFPEPVATPGTYAVHIYGAVRVANAPLVRAAPSAGADAGVAPQVTVLTARKKKKKPAVE